MTTPPSIFPYLRYRDARAAIAWLQQAFGFRVALEVPGANGGIGHAELQLGNGMVMLGDQPNEMLGMQPAAAGGGGNSQGIYIVVANVDAVYASAVAAGARIVIALHDTDYGSRDFSCRDPEGQLWSIGSYQPPMLEG
ncbi:VOC family protein [Ferrovibrio sp.]|uniref:VOC family protein n=1 Tax=Ferrovibrio sp. TaxID=1917215 RepID=UPI003D0F84F1